MRGTSRIHFVLKCHLKYEKRQGGWVNTVRKVRQGDMNECIKGIITRQITKGRSHYRKNSIVRGERDQGCLELPESSEYTSYSTLVVRVR